MTLRDVVKQTQWVYSFGQADGSRRELLGGKGAGLADMTAASLPVPPGVHHHHGGMPRLLRLGQGHAGGDVGAGA